MNSSSIDFTPGLHTKRHEEPRTTAHTRFLCVSKVVSLLFFTMLLLTSTAHAVLSAPGSPAVASIFWPPSTPTPTPVTGAPPGRWILQHEADGLQTWVWQPDPSTPSLVEPTMTSTPIIVVIEPTPCAPDAAYVTDVTIPDHTLIAPGGRFDKTWRIRNNGECAWQPGVRLQFIAGSKLNGADHLPVAPVAPNTTMDVTVSLQAPESPGTYTGVWQLADSEGILFGQRLTVVIEVPSLSPPTLTPTALPPPKQFSAQLVRWWPNCGISLVRGKIVEPNGDPVNGLRVRVWADGWDGARSLVSGIGLTYGPGEWDVVLRQGQSGKFYVAVSDWQTGPDSYTPVDSDVLVLDFNYTQDNCQPDGDGHQVAEVRFVRNY